jgi:hypothetical protein
MTTTKVDMLKVLIEENLQISEDTRRGLVHLQQVLTILGNHMVHKDDDIRPLHWQRLQKRREARRG